MLLVVSYSCNTFARYYEKISNIKLLFSIPEPIVDIEKSQDTIVKKIISNTQIQEFCFTIRNFKNMENCKKISEVDFEFEIEIKIENKETVVFAHGKKITEEKLQSLENSLAVSKIAGIANNSNAYKIVEKYIDNYKQKYNVIFSGRDTKKIYPKLNYHIFLTADIDKRVEWKSSQYNQKRKEEIKENILKRDKLQKKAGYYETYNDTIIIDLSSSNSIEESTKQVLNHILEYKELL